MMYGDGWDNMGWAGWIGMTLMFVFWIAVIALIITAIMRAGTLPPAALDQGSTRSDQSLTILRERFARGEITSSEYEQAKQLLIAERQ